MKKYSLLLFVPVLLASCGIPEEVDTANIDFVEALNESKENNDIIIQEDIVIFPEPNGLIKVNINTLGEAIPKAKDDGDLPVILTFTAGGATLNAYGAIKVQGSSTAKWPKKNWTLKFYADENRSERLRLKIGDSVASDKWIAKAEWVDPSLLRNSVSFKLWEAMTQSRKGFPQYEVDNAWIGKNNMAEGTQTSAQGFPKSHPIHITMDEEHYGLSMLLLGHEPDNFNIDQDNPEHIYMEFDARGGDDPTKSWEKFSADAIGSWIEGYYPKDEDFSDEQRAAIDTFGDLINGSQINFENNFDKHFDKMNMIDMLLFLEVIYDYDAVAQDLEMVTYNLEKWCFLPWDKDTTFGMDWNEGGIKSESSKELLINYEDEDEDEEQKPWFKSYHAFKPDVEARYAQLRNENIFSVYGLHQLTGDITKKIPQEIWEAEEVRWKGDGRPSLDETSTAQVISWFEERLEMLDGHFNYVP